MKAKALAFYAIMAMSSSASWASVVSITPSLPPVGADYVSSGAGCFPAAGVCVVPGTVTIDSVVSSMFDSSGQEFVTAITVLGTLTTLGNAPIGPVTLSGTMDEEVLGRTSSTETGTWTTELAALSLTGSVLGHTLSVGLDSTQTSSGQTSLVPDGAEFLVDSFFDVFLELSLDSSPPLHAAIGPLELTLEPQSQAAPEPSSLALLGIALAALGLQRHIPGGRKSPRPSHCDGRSLAN